MRILICTVGSPGHQRPLYPLVGALVRAGSNVLWATAPDALEPVREATGAPALGVGVTMQAARTTYRERWPEAVTLAGEALAAHTFPRLFGGVVAPAMLPALANLLTEWKPDLVIGEPAALAVPVSCDAAQIPYAIHGYGLRIPRSHIDIAARELAATWTNRKQAWHRGNGLYRHGYIDIVPPSLIGARDAGPPPARTWKLRPSAGNPTVRLPISIKNHLQAQRRPIVYLSFGTAYNDANALMDTALALSRLAVQVIVTHGEPNTDTRWTQCPGNILALGFIDQAALLPYCDLVVSHAGAGTLLGAAAAGLPQLLLPRGADQFRNARALQAIGAAASLAPEQRDEQTIFRTAAALLDSASVRHNAKRLAAEIALMPDADVVAGQLLQESWRAPRYRSV